MAAGHVNPAIKATVIANTVNDAVIDAPAILAWRNDVADKVDSNYDFLSTKANLASPNFTGVPTAPTATAGTFTTQVATTAFARSEDSANFNIILNYAALTYVPNTQINLSGQAIINSGMNVAQMGTSFSNPANSAYTLDMWANRYTNTGTLPTTITHTQNALTAGELFNSYYSYQVSPNGAGSGFGTSDSYGQSQRIEFGTRYLAGATKQVSVSIYAKSSIATKRIAVGMKQAYGTGGSPTSVEILTPTASTIRSLTSTVALYTFTFTTNTLSGKTFGTNNDDYLELTIYEMWGATFATNNLGGGTAETFVGSGNINFTEIQLNAGGAALPFQPKSFDDELGSCQRYYEKSYDYATLPGAATGVGAIYSAAFAVSLIVGFKYKKVKRITNPTVSIYSPSGTPGTLWNGSDVNISSGAVAINIGDSATRYISLSGAGLTTLNLYAYHYIVDARL